MNHQLTAETFLPWLSQESHKLAVATSSGGDPFPDLWSVATDAHDWLRHTSSEERDRALETVRQFLDIGCINDVAIPPDEHQAKCLVTLLQWVLNPPHVL
jgi:hypothetical protein